MISVNTKNLPQAEVLFLYTTYQPFSQFIHSLHRAWAGGDYIYRMKYGILNRFYSKAVTTVNSGAGIAKKTGLLQFIQGFPQFIQDTGPAAA